MKKLSWEKRLSTRLNFLVLPCVLSEAVWYPISAPFYGLTTKTYSGTSFGLAGGRLSLALPRPPGHPSTHARARARTRARAHARARARARARACA